MSARIEEILEVVQEVRENHRCSEKDRLIKETRIEAVYAVAIRQLRPEVKLAVDFDKLLDQWLIHNSDELRRVILNHCVEPSDEEFIEQVFHKASEEELHLAEEFGLEVFDETFLEGKEKLRIHLIKERNKSLLRRAKLEWLQEQNGDIRCEICSFSFFQTYGELGKGFIEAHHTKPISSLTPGTIVHIEDLIPVCSNCHSMLHHHRPWLTAENLQETMP